MDMRKVVRSSKSEVRSPKFKGIQRFILSALFLLAIITSGSAQRFRGGVVGGFNLSQLDGDRLSGFNQPGLQAGGRVAAVLSDRWQLSMELLFSQQGSSRTRYDDPSSAYERIRLNMVEVPVMINFLEWKLHVSAGLSYGRVIDFRVRDALGGDVTDLQNYRNSLLLGIVSATYYFREDLGISIGWSKALTNLQADKAAGTLIARNVHVRMIYLW